MSANHQQHRSLVIYCLFKFSADKKLFKHLRLRYNKVQFKQLNELVKSRRRLQNLTLDNHFFNECIVNKVVPKFLSTRIQKSKVKCSPTIERAFLNDEISKTVSTIRFIKSKYNSELQSISEWISDLDKLRFLRHLSNLDRREKKKNLTKHNKTVEYLKMQRFGKFNNCKSPNVQNLSSYKLSSSELFVLSLGLKFSVPPRNISREIVFSEFEVLAGQLNHHKPQSKEHLERLRAKLYDLSHAYCGTPVDLSDYRMYNECFQTYKALKNNSDIIISRPDKGSGVVILDRSDYVSKMSTILCDNSKFIKIGPASRFDFTAKIEGAIRRRLRSMCKNDFISDSIHDLIRPVGSQRPKLYGLPKTHKVDCPLRPILSMLNSPQNKLAKFLVHILKPVLDKFSTYQTPDSFEFVKSLKSLNLNKEVFMCSFDIKSLFTNVPLNEVIKICLEQLYHSDIIPPEFNEDTCNELLKLATTNVDFSFNDTMYRQIDGVAMGSPLGPILANIFVGYQEKHLFSKIKKPIMYTRYMDDIFALFHSRDEIDKFLVTLNRMHSSLVFTKEDETNGVLAFLDVNIERSGSSFVTSVYRKPTFKGDYVPWNSFCPKGRKRNLISCLVHRAIKICSPCKFDDEIEFIVKMFLDLGYPEFEINNTIKKCLELSNNPRVFGPEKCPVYLRLPYIGNVSGRFEKQLRDIVGKTYGSVRLRTVYKTRKLLTGINKDVSPTHDKNNVIYKFKCHCDSEYVGRTSQRFHIRRDQHVPKLLRNWIDGNSPRPFHRHYFTAIGQHLFDNPICARNYNDSRFSIVTCGRNNFHLNVLESIFIKINKPNLCKQKQYIYNTLLFTMLL